MLPMAIASVVEQVPGVTRYQIIQTAPDQIKVRLEVESGADRAAIWAKMEAELREFFMAQGAAPVQAILADEAPRSTRSAGNSGMCIENLSCRDGLPRSGHGPGLDMFGPVRAAFARTRANSLNSLRDGVEPVPYKPHRYFFANLAVLADSNFW